MKVIILSGGLGTRISEYTKTIPKPLIKIGKYPILIHIMKHYLDYKFNEFIIATGYKKNLIKRYFKNFEKEEKPFDFKINNNRCKITIVDTGSRTMTGGRIKRLQKFFKKDEKFMFTYGDGISNVNLTKLKKFHLKQKKIVTVTAVHPPARFGEIIIKKNLVTSFKEKPQIKTGWINGGFFVTDYNFFKFLKNDKEILEKKPLEKLSRLRKLSVFRHNGFWKCMDTVRDRDVLNKILKGKTFF